jgi:hypothetical protein
MVLTGLEVEHDRLGDEGAVDDVLGDPDVGIEQLVGGGVHDLLLGPFLSTRRSCRDVART